MSNPKTLFSELRRRRVFNTIVIYIIGAWVAIQAVDLALPGLDKPQEAIRYAWYAAIALFPLMLVFAWPGFSGASAGFRTWASAFGSDCLDTLARTWLFLRDCPVADCLVTACLAILPLAFRWRPAMCGAPITG